MTVVVVLISRLKSGEASVNKPGVINDFRLNARQIYI